MVTPLGGLDEIDWAALDHAYGPAGDVPDLLRGVAAGPEPDRALHDLENGLYHQGGFVCSAATAALPYLTAMAGDSAIAVRPGLLELIGRLVHEANTVSAVHEGWPDAWAAALPRVLALLADPDTQVRRETPSTPSAARGDADLIVPALRAGWEVEDDGPVRLGIVIAVGELAGGCTAEVLPEALVWLRGLRGHDDVQVGMAAELALAEAVEAQRPDAGVLKEAVRGDVTVWRDVPWVGDMPSSLTGFYGAGASRLLDWVARRLGGDVAARTDLAAAFLGDRDADRRIGAVRVADDLLTAWRSPVTRLLPGLVRGSADESPAVRAHATYLLAALDEGGTGVLADRLDDDAPLPPHGEDRIADLAAWGLARRRDPRCLPRLRDRLAGDPCMTGTDAGTGPPVMRHVLAPLGEHAAALLPAIRARLAEPAAARGLAEALAEWGPAAAPRRPGADRAHRDGRDDRGREGARRHRPGRRGRGRCVGRAARHRERVGGTASGGRPAVGALEGDR